MLVYSYDCYRMVYVNNQNSQLYSYTICLVRHANSHLHANQVQALNLIGGETKQQAACSSLP